MPGQAAPGEVRPVAEIDHAPREAFIHRHIRLAGERVARVKPGAVTPHALFVAQRLDERLAQRDAAILDGVVVVHLDVTVATQVQVHRRVLCEQCQHVIEERDAGVDFRFASAVDVQAEPNLRLAGVAFDLCLSWLHS